MALLAAKTVVRAIASGKASLLRHFLIRCLLMRPASVQTPITATDVDQARSNIAYQKVSSLDSFGAVTNQSFRGTVILGRPLGYPKSQLKRMQVRTEQAAALTSGASNADSLVHSGPYPRRHPRGHQEVGSARLRQLDVDSRGFDDGGAARRVCQASLEARMASRGAPFLARIDVFTPLRPVPSQRVYLSRRTHASQIPRCELED